MYNNFTSVHMGVLRILLEFTLYYLIIFTSVYNLLWTMQRICFYLYLCTW